MVRPSTTRWLAPLALAAALLSVLLVVTRSSGSGSGSAAPSAAPSGATTGASTSRARRGAGSRSRSTTTPTTGTVPIGGRRTYRVRRGDTLGAIAQRAGVPVQQLQQLNPSLDPQSLTVGQKIRLAGGG